MSNKHVGIYALIFVLVLFGSLMGSDKPAAVAAEKPIVWNATHHSPMQHPNVQNMLELTNEVTKRTNGRIKFTVTPGGSLYGPFDQTPALMRGFVQMGPYMSVFNPDLIPEMEVYDLPLMLLPDKPMRGAQDVESLFRAFAKRVGSDKTRAYWTKEIANRLGLRILYYDWYAPVFAFTNKPLRTVADWKGQKLRTYSVLTAGAVEALGGSAIVMPKGELYSALQTGLVDGTVTSFITVYEMAGADAAKVLKYASMWPIAGGVVITLAANQGAYQALPEDIRATLDQTIIDLKLSERSLEVFLEKDMEAIAKMPNVEIVPVSVEEMKKGQQLMKPVVQAWAKRCGGKARDSFEVMWGDLVSTQDFVGSK